jgi:hypothetical protein
VKFLLALGVFVGMGALLAGGIVATMHGSPWLLVISILAYLAAFSRIGCGQH